MYVCANRVAAAVAQWTLEGSTHSQSAPLMQTADHSLPPLTCTQAEFMEVSKQSC